MAQKKVADLLVEVLAEAGVRRIYGVSGDSLNGITDSMRARRYSMGCMRDTKKRPPLPPERKRILRAHWRSAPEAAVRAICI